VIFSYHVVLTKRRTENICTAYPDDNNIEGFFLRKLGQREHFLPDFVNEEQQKTTIQEQK